MRGIAQIERQAEQGVRLGDGGEPADERHVSAPVGARGEMVAAEEGGKRSKAVFALA